jgi:hypothetical protein
MQAPTGRPVLRLLARLRLNRCGVLLAGLLIYIQLYPFSVGQPQLRLAVDGFLLLLLVTGLWAIRPQRRFLRWLVLVLCAIAAHLLLPVMDGLAHRPSRWAVAALMEAMLAASLFAYVLDVRRVTLDKVFGAIAAYLLLAMLFSSAYLLLLAFQPHAFSAPEAASEPIHWFTMFYFSVTVLTSTGFGEILPVTNQARALVLLEQVAGVMYVAFLVARLANIYQRRR